MYTRPPDPPAHITTTFAASYAELRGLLTAEERQTLVELSRKLACSTDPTDQLWQRLSDLMLFARHRGLDAFDDFAIQLEKEHEQRRREGMA